MTWESRFSIGMASSRSRPLPCGTPSTMSMSTTSASSLDGDPVGRRGAHVSGAYDGHFLTHEIPFSASDRIRS